MSTTPFQQKGSEGRELDAGEVDAVLEKGIRYFGNRICPFAHRAWWAATETGFAKDMDYIHINLKDTKPEWYPTKVNPSGTVPCLYIDSKPIFESYIVAEYINEVTGNKLWPSDPVQRATGRFLVTSFGEKIIGKLYKFLMTGDEEVWGQAKEALEHFDSVFAKSKAEGGSFFGGEELTLVELCIIPFLYRFSVLYPHYREKNLFKDAAIPTLEAAFQNATKRDAFKATSLKDEDLIFAYKGYVKK